MTRNANEMSMPPNDNALRHTAQATRALLGQIGWDVLAQSPHGPDLTPIDLFTRLKETLGGGKRFKNDEVYRFHVRT